MKLKIKRSKTFEGVVWEFYEGIKYLYSNKTLIRIDSARDLHDLRIIFLVAITKKSISGLPVQVRFIE